MLSCWFADIFFLSVSCLFYSLHISESLSQVRLGCSVSIFVIIQFHEQSLSARFLYKWGPSCQVFVFFCLSMMVHLWSSVCMTFCFMNFVSLFEFLIFRDKTSHFLNKTQMVDGLRCFWRVSRSLKYIFSHSVLDLSLMWLTVASVPAHNLYA